MALPEGRTRLTITLADDVLALVDKERTRTALTRSQIISAALLEKYDVVDEQKMSDEQMLAFVESLLAKRRRGLEG